MYLIYCLTLCRSGHEFVSVFKQCLDSSNMDIVNSTLHNLPEFCLLAQGEFFSLFCSRYSHGEFQFSNMCQPLSPFYSYGIVQLLQMIGKLASRPSLAVEIDGHSSKRECFCLVYFINSSGNVGIT